MDVLVSVLRWNTLSIIIIIIIIITIIIIGVKNVRIF